MYSIGEFSKISGLSIKTLRHYHDKGILEPSSVDRQSGYRYYSKVDIDKARVVTGLKDMRFSLADIQQIVSTHSEDEDLLEFLFNKQQSIQQEVKRLSGTLKAISTLIKKEQESIKMKNQATFTIEEKSLPELRVVSMHWQGAYSETGKAVAAVYRAAGRYSDGASLNLYHECEKEGQDADVETCLPVKKEVTGKNCKYKVLPAGQFITLIHKGSYEGLGESYAKVFDYIREQKKEALTPTREIYIKGPGMLFRGNPDNYLTEIQIPVK